MRSKILYGAEGVRTADKLLDEAVAVGELPGGDAKWSEAASWFRDVCNDFYADVGRHLDLLRHDDRQGIEYAIAFLEADPWCFRSGYSKERMLTVLGRCTLTEEDVRRLQTMALRAVNGPQRREFGYHCRLVSRRLDIAPLRDELRGRLYAADHGVARRALTMLMRIKKVKLSEQDRERARTILERAVTDDDWEPGWARKATTRFWNEAWERRLLNGVATQDVAASTSLRLLSMANALQIDDQERALLQRCVLQLVDVGGDEMWLEPMAALVNTPGFELQLDEQLSNVDTEVARRARWALGAIRRRRERSLREGRPSS